jgi:hypothetical protein
MQRHCLTNAGRALLCFVCLLGLSGLLAVSNALAEGDAGNYELTIGGHTMPVDLGKEYKVTTPGGESVTVMLRQREVLTHDEALFSLRYPSSLNLSATTAVDKEISQVIAISGLGNGFVLQAYTSMNPSLLVDAMLDESIKQDLAFGFKLDKKPFSRELSSGQTMTGVEATLTYQGQTKHITVSAYGKRDQGLLLITIMHPDMAATDGAILDTLWASLKLKI